MDRKTLIRKLDEGVTSLRGLLADNDGSALQALAASTRQGFNSLKAAFKENDGAQKAMAEIKKHLDDLEESVKKGDQKLSAKLLAAAEKKIRQYRDMYENQASGDAPSGEPLAIEVDAGKPAAAKTASDKSKAADARPEAADAKPKAAAAKPGAASAGTKAPAKPKTAAKAAPKKPAAKKTAKP